MPVPVMPCALAVMLAVPEATPVTSPPGEVIVAMVVSEDVQLRVSPEICFWLPSEYVPVAVNWTMLLTATVDEAGVTKIELSEGLIKKPLQPHVTKRITAMPAVSTTRTLVAERGRGADKIMTIISSQNTDSKYYTATGASRVCWGYLGRALKISKDFD